MSSCNCGGTVVSGGCNSCGLKPLAPRMPSMSSNPSTKFWFDKANCRLEWIKEWVDSCGIMQSDSQTVDVSEFGQCITLGGLNNVCGNVDEAPPCAMLVAGRSNTCDPCDVSFDCDAEGQTVWTWKTIETAEETGCELEPDEEGYIKVLTLDDCGCIQECKVKLIPGVWVGEDGNGTPVRDGVWVDADWPIYYGTWWEDFDLDLASRFPEIFGKFDLDVTVTFRYHLTRPDAGSNVHSSASFTPFIKGTSPDMLNDVGWLDGSQALVIDLGQAAPWGTVERTGQVRRILKKGEDLSVRTQTLLRNGNSFPNPWTTPLDGQMVSPEHSTLDSGLTNFSKFYDVRIFVSPVVRHTVADSYATPPASTNPGAVFVPPDVV